MTVRVISVTDYHARRLLTLIYEENEADVMILNQAGTDQLHVEGYMEICSYFSALWQRSDQRYLHHQSPSDGSFQ